MFELAAGQYLVGGTAAGQWTWAPLSATESDISWDDPKTCPPKSAMGATIGAFAGNLLHAAGKGATVGLVLGGVLWTGAAVWSHLCPRPSPGRRRRD